jgi:rifampicin phosphotransferase
MMLALPFQSPDALDATRSGGKGANLARLTQAGLPVPEGFIITADAYRFFADEAKEALKEVGQLARADVAQMESQCAVLQDHLHAIEFPANVMAAIDQMMSTYPAGMAFSVRSSATTEDLGGAAFAGQHETYLNCIGADDVIRHVKECWISLWSGRAVAYRIGAHFDVADTAMAVVVQRMAFCDVAGVGFSMNPINGELAQQVFDANFGLGESVVSGESPVDHFIIDKATGKVLEQTISEKFGKTVASRDGRGVEYIELAESEKCLPCLPNDALHELSEMARRVEQVYGFPQDIEWGFVNDKLWLLQSRPITRMAARWTRDESAERFPNVITPLAWALVEEGFHRSLNYSFDLMGLPPFKDKWFAMFDHYIYGNQTGVEVYAQGAASNIRIGSLAELQTAIPVLRKQYEWVLELPLVWSRDLDHYLISLGELMSERLEGQSLSEIWNYVLRVKELGAEYFLPNIAISITQRTLYRLLLMLLEAMVGKEDAAATFDKLLAYCETKTGIINKELFRLAGQIAATPDLAERLRATDSSAFVAQGGFASWPKIDAVFNKFLRDHGHREVEFDPYHPTWLEAPWLVVDNLKAMLESQLADPGEQERELKIAMRQTEDALIAKVPESIRYFVHEIIRLARVYTTLDDVEHYQTTRLTLPFRKGLRALGDRLTEKGVIESPMDVFFAQYAELSNAIKKDSDEIWHVLAVAIASEKSAYLAHRGIAPSQRLGEAECVPVASAKALAGLAGSPGVASGEVFKVFSAADFGAFPKGAILVARTTNPAWTPLFYKASAVITESGGPLSHGAVTAREIGLPAVMGVRGAMSVLSNGQQVTVNGTRGTVVLN